jgi:peptidoglycan/LPS O-acetylase OafA/YrhL
MSVVGSIALMFRSRSADRSAASSENTVQQPRQDAVVLSPAPAATAEAAAARHEARNEALDAVRFFAAAAVVFVHSARSSSFANWGNLFRFAVPFYLFASLYYQALSARRNPQRTLGHYAIARFKKLYMPFAAWTLIYLLARDIKRATVLSLPPVPPALAVLWQGTAYHLWFLPFLLLCSILFAALLRGLAPAGRHWRWLAIAIAIVAGLAAARAPLPAGWDETFDNPTYAFVQWWRAVPATCFAMGFALLMTIPKQTFTISPLMALAGLALAVACIVKQALQGMQLIPRGVSGLGCMLVALAPWRGPVVASLAKLGRNGYGIYLCHVIVVEVLHVLAGRAHVQPAAWSDLLIFLISFAGSLALVRALDRFRWLAWLNG